MKSIPFHCLNSDMPWSICFGLCKTSFRVPHRSWLEHYRLLVIVIKVGIQLCDFPCLHVADWQTGKANHCCCKSIYLPPTWNASCINSVFIVINRIILKYEREMYTLKGQELWNIVCDMYPLPHNTIISPRLEDRPTWPISYWNWFWSVYL